VGLIFTDRSLTDGSGAFNRVFGGDARLVFGGRYTLTTQLAGSLTRDAGEDAHDGLQPLLKMDVARSGRSFSWNLGLTDVAPDFRARSGFITRPGDAEVTGGMSFTHFRAPGSFVQTASVRVTSQNFFRHEDLWDGSLPFEHEVEVWPTLSLRGGRTLTFVVRRGYFRFLPEDYENYGVLGADGPTSFQVPASLKGMNAWGLIPRMRINNALNVNGMAFFRQVPIFAEASRGYEVQVSPEIQYRPTTQLQLSLNYRYSKIHRKRAETLEDRIAEEYSTVNLPRLRVQYQFNKSLFVRGVAQWELQDRSALVDPLSGDPLLLYGSEVPASSTGEFQGQFLVQYQPSPGTIFYIGYSRLMEGRRSYSLDEMNPVEEGLFVKLSYLFRM